MFRKSQDFVFFCNCQNNFPQRFCVKNYLECTVVEFEALRHFVALFGLHVLDSRLVCDDPQQEVPLVFLLRAVNRSEKVENQPQTTKGSEKGREKA